MQRYIFGIFFLVACNLEASRRRELREMIESRNANKVVEAYFRIGESRDSTFVPDIFKNVDDQRVSHDLRFKGMNVYYQKMGAMKKITGIDPPRPITDDVDSTIVNFYANIARERGWIR